MQRYKNQNEKQRLWCVSDFGILERFIVNIIVPFLALVGARSHPHFRLTLPCRKREWRGRWNWIRVRSVSVRWQIRRDRPQQFGQRSDEYCINLTVIEMPSPWPWVRDKEDNANKRFWDIRRGAFGSAWASILRCFHPLAKMTHSRVRNSWLALLESTSKIRLSYILVLWLVNSDNAPDSEPWLKERTERQVRLRRRRHEGRNALVRRVVVQNVPRVATENRLELTTRRHLNKNTYFN